MDDENKTENILEFKELEKAKIDILRDALKDVADTIRAIDRKIFFLVSSVVIIPNIFIAILMYFLKIDDNLWLIILCAVVILSPFIFAFIPLIRAVEPLINPLDSFHSCDDKAFGNDCFFINTITKGRGCHESDSKKEFILDDLLKKFDKNVSDSNKAKKLLFKEIVKLSFIRDNKISLFGKSFKKFLFGLGTGIVVLGIVASLKAIGIL